MPSTTTPTATELATRLHALADDLHGIGVQVDTLDAAPSWVPRFPGDVPPGRVRWGAAVGGNTDPTQRHEQPAGAPLGVRRTYWRWDQATTMTATARADLAAGRVPWVSIKPPATPGWADMAAGKYDTALDAMLRGLDALGGPVWLTVHHEPEGGGGVPAGQTDDPGGAPAWRAMQVHVRARMKAIGTRNIALAPVLMSWTWAPASGRNPTEWWVAGTFDFLGVDHYVTAEKHDGPGTPTDTLWTAVATWANTRRVPVALGEWGNRGTDDRAAWEMSTWYDRCCSTTAQPQVIAAAYFDSDLNSPSGGWSLQGAPLVRFQQLMADPRSITVPRPA